MGGFFYKELDMFHVGFGPFWRTTLLKRYAEPTQNHRYLADENRGRRQKGEVL